TIDVTPSDDNTAEVLRGLQIYGSLLMESGSALEMALTSDVLTGNYDPLRVTAEDKESIVVTLIGDLQLTLQGHFSSERWITLLATDGLISGTFSTVNGNAFGEDDHFILTYGGIDYDFFVHYNQDLGGDLVGVALYAIP